MPLKIPALMENADDVYSALGRAEEYARLAVFMAENNYLNGEYVRLDGAIRMAPR